MASYPTLTVHPLSDGTLPAAEAVALAHYAADKSTARVQRAAAQVVLCYCCGRSFPAAAIDPSTSLCEHCYYVAGLENEHSDGLHAEAPDADCDECQDAF